MSISEWIRDLEAHGFQTFSVERVREAFPGASEQNIMNSLYRMTVKRRIISVYKGFYVIMPPQYSVKGIVAPAYYIDRLMEYIGKPYYVGLLNAAEQHGAAHQRSQRFSVMTIYPSANPSKTKNNILDWVYRKEVPEKFLQTKNAEMGVIRFSNPELTAIDLVQYEKHAGGLSRAATVLAELVEQTDFSKVPNELFDYTSVSAIQRLGFILDNVLEKGGQADVLYERLHGYGKRLNYVPLSTRSTNGNAGKDVRWKININTDIEIDDL
ncbi:MAG: type IV toxin-antitoxin system AbiEi family antitoxin [Alistipes sp.]|nr:type IV toxin-antitoxin system AbiEi family antitoxin [Alistipes sp.]